MAQFLELAKFSHGHSMPQMQIRGARVEAAVHLEWTTFFLGFSQPFTQLVCHGLFELFIAVLGTLHQKGYLFVYCHFLHFNLRHFPREICLKMQTRITI